MTKRNIPNIIIERVNLDRYRDDYDVFAESREEFLATETMPKPDLSIDDMENLTKEALKLWETDRAYIFHVLDATTGQVVGFAQLNLVNRLYQMANLSYQVRTSRAGEGIASEAARLVVKYGFEKLGFQRIEVVVAVDNAPSLRVAEKIGAVREGRLRNRLQINGSPRDAYMHSLIPSDYDINNTAFPFLAGKMPNFGVRAPQNSDPNPVKYSGAGLHPLRTPIFGNSFTSVKYKTTIFANDKECR